MSASQALKAAHEAGVRIAVDGETLMLEADAPPPARVLDLLLLHKAELIALLRPRDSKWTAQDWQDYFSERAGIVEFDGGLTRPEAEAKAVDCCIAEWLRRHPVGPPSDRCLGCGGVEDGDTLLVFGGSPTGTWLHSRCWQAWNRVRLMEARSALAAIGIG